MHRVHDNPRAGARAARSSLISTTVVVRQRERESARVPPRHRAPSWPQMTAVHGLVRARAPGRRCERSGALAVSRLARYTQLLLGFGGNRSIACARPRSSSNLLRPNKKTCTHAHHPWSDARSGQVTAGEIPANSACSSTLERARQHARPVHVRVRASARHSAPPQPLPGRLRTPVLPIRPS
jgi:hypothetical protein